MARYAHWHCDWPSCGVVKVNQWDHRFTMQHPGAEWIERSQHYGQQLGDFCSLLCFAKFREADVAAREAAHDEDLRVFDESVIAIDNRRDIPDRGDLLIRAVRLERKSIASFLAHAKDVVARGSCLIIRYEDDARFFMLSLDDARSKEIIRIAAEQVYGRSLSVVLTGTETDHTLEL